MIIGIIKKWAKSELSKISFKQLKKENPGLKKKEILEIKREKEKQIENYKYELPEETS